MFSFKKNFVGLKSILKHFINFNNLFIQYMLRFHVTLAKNVLKVIIIIYHHKYLSASKTKLVSSYSIKNIYQPLFATVYYLEGLSMEMTPY